MRFRYAGTIDCLKFIGLYVWYAVCKEFKQRVSQLSGAPLAVQAFSAWSLFGMGVPMPRYNLKSLLKTVTTTSVFFAVAQSAGFGVTLTLAFLLWALWWAIRSHRRSWMLGVRSMCGLVCLVFAWFLVVDWSCFQWYCPDCCTSQEFYQSRLLGMPVSVHNRGDASSYSLALSDLGVACEHVDASYEQLERAWGMVFPTQYDPGFRTTNGYDDRYSLGVRDAMRRRGQGDREFAEAVYNQLVVKKNYRYFYDVLIADGLVEASIADASTHEALAWLDRYEVLPSSRYGYGCDCGEAPHLPEAIKAMVGEVYQLDASSVLAVGVTEIAAIRIKDTIYPQSDYTYELVMQERERYPFVEDVVASEAEYLAIKLPATEEKRASIFAWEAQRKLMAGEIPTNDYGQDYLLFELWDLLE